MKSSKWPHFLIGALATVVGFAQSWGGVETQDLTNQPPPRQVTGGAPSEDRSSRAKESREDAGRRGAMREEMQKRREEWEKLSADERRAAFREWRLKREKEARSNPEEREMRRKVMRERLGRQLADLHRKKLDGTLTDEEQNRLERLEEIARRFERGGLTNSGPALTRPGDTPPRPNRRSETNGKPKEPRP